MYIKSIKSPEADLWNAVVDLALYDIEVMNRYIKSDKYMKIYNVKELVNNNNSAILFFEMLKDVAKKSVEEELSKYEHVTRMHVVACKKCKKHKIMSANDLKVLKKCLCMELIWGKKENKANRQTRDT